MVKPLSTSERVKALRSGVGAMLLGQRDLAGKCISAAVSGQWEGHERSRQRQRPGVRLVAQDTDLDLGVREALLSEARSLSQTFPVVKRIKRAFINYTVGSCRIEWDTGDQKTNEAYAAFWENWMPIADANGAHNFKKLTQIVAGEVVDAGDIFGQKVFLSGFGQVRLIEGDRVNNGYGAPTNIDTEKVIGGIKMDAQGRRVSARVWERDRYGNFKNKQDIPWAQLFHIYDPDRVDAVRGVTRYHSALNTARDYKELIRAEQLAAKRNSKLALIVKSIMGGASAGGGIDLSSNDVPTSSGENKVDVQDVSDVADAYMFPNEDMKAHTSDRPSEGWRWLTEQLIREIALSTDLPYGVVWNMAGLGGPGARFEIAQAGRTFQGFMEMLEQKWIRPVAGWKISEAMATGRVPKNPNWTKFTIQRPGQITIDLGREYKAGIDAIRFGVESAMDWAAEGGRTIYEIQRDNAKAAKHRAELAEEFGIDVSEIRMATPNGNPAQTAGQEQPQPEPDPEKKAA